jgi:hypothetical protein
MHDCHVLASGLPKRHHQKVNKMLYDSTVDRYIMESLHIVCQNTLYIQFSSNFSNKIFYCEEVYMYHR